MEIQQLKEHLAAKDAEIKRLRKLLDDQTRTLRSASVLSADAALPERDNAHLTNADIARYSRQLILPELGVKGQMKLKNSRVLVVGCGGLGCPAAVYLAAAGIGCIGLVDYDEVELSNLHRQILHTEAKVGCTKSSSVAHGCNQLNSSVTCIPYHIALTSQNAMSLVKKYDIILDATDNVTTRYLLNDACILANKPLVSGSALRFEGQLTVYNYKGGPCYRCLYPKPPPPETVTNCSDGGVLGVVPGIIGSLQALEAIKIACDMEPSFSQRLLLFDALDTFRTIKLRPRQAKCVVCGENPSVTELIDYVQFCGAAATDKDHGVTILEGCDRISVQEYADLVKTEEEHILVDVRQPVEMEICQLPVPSINLPMEMLDKPDQLQQVEQQVKAKQHCPVIVVCRRGNDSQVAVKVLQKVLTDVKVKDIKGGLHAWAKHIDLSFPVY